MSLTLHYWPTPNGQKILILLAELGLDCQLEAVDLRTGEQHRPAFLAISPNNKVPALIDHAPPRGGAPVVLFESGAILLYLAEKHEVFLGGAARPAVLQWLFWQVGGLGPMAGQNLHFAGGLAADMHYGRERFRAETARLYRVLDGQLARSEWIAGEYTVADMACYPWIVSHAAQGQDLPALPHLQRWFAAMAARAAVRAAYARAAAFKQERGL